MTSPAHSELQIATNFFYCNSHAIRRAAHSCNNISLYLAIIAYIFMYFVIDLIYYLRVYVTTYPNIIWSKMKVDTGGQSVCDYSQSNLV